MNESLMIEATHCDSVLGNWTSSHWALPHDNALSGAVDRIWNFGGALIYRR